MIRIITDDDYIQFIQQYVDMILSIDLYKNKKVSVIVAELNEQVKQPGFFAVGDFKDTTLLGFICGYTESNGVWFQSGLNHSIPYRVSKLIKVTEQMLKDAKYTHWTTEYSKHDNRCLALKLGAKVQTIKYIKEI